MAWGEDQLALKLEILESTENVSYTVHGLQFEGTNLGKLRM